MRYFKTSSEIICLALMLYVRFSSARRNVDDMLHERCLVVRHGTGRSWWLRFEPLFAAEIGSNRIERLRS